MKKRYWLIAAILFFSGLITYYFIYGYQFTGLLLCGLSVVTLILGLLNTIKRTAFHVVFYVLLGGSLVGSTVTGAFIGNHCDGAENSKAEYVIVLGAGVNGSKPSAALYERMQAALEYAETYPNATLVLSGGQGEGENLTEARCMYEWLKGKGVSEKRLWLEEKATNTEENLRFSLDLIERKTGKRPDEIAVISSEYHLLRAELIAKLQGVEEVLTYPASTDNPLYFGNMFLREIVAVWSHYLGF